MIIRIKNLRLNAVIGANPWENDGPQALIINAEVEFDGTAVSVSDRLEDTIDYTVISKRLIEHAENNRYQLIETLAGKLIKTLFEDSRVTRAKIEVDKPKALWCADSTSVELEESRG